jgi:hypothetical protein
MHKDPIPGDRRMEGRYWRRDAVGQTLVRPGCIEAMPVNCIRWRLRWPSAGRIDEPTRIRGLRRADDSFRRPLLDDLAAIDDIDALGDLTNDAQALRRAGGV